MLEIGYRCKGYIVVGFNFSLPKESIAVVEARSGSPLPGVECGASFSDMGLGLERLAAFLEATQAV